MAFFSICCLFVTHALVCGWCTSRSEARLASLMPLLAVSPCSLPLLTMRSRSCAVIKLRCRRVKEKTQDNMDVKESVHFLLKKTTKNKTTHLDTDVMTLPPLARYVLSLPRMQMTLISMYVT